MTIIAESGVTTTIGTPTLSASATSCADGSGSARGWVCTTATVFSGMPPRHDTRWNSFRDGHSRHSNPPSRRTRNAARSS